MKVGAIVMAAGLGTRMKSEHPKVLHSLGGKPILFYILDLLLQTHVKKAAIVVSYQKERIIKEVSSAYGSNHPFVFVDQKKPLGTGHAVLMTKRIFKHFKDPIVILSGDSPLLTRDTFLSLVRYHQKNKAELTVGSCMLDVSVPYGRVIRDRFGNLKEIVEATDAAEQELQIQEMNIGLYCTSPQVLYQALKKITPNNKKSEYYLTDVVKNVDRKILFCIKNKEEVLGINDRSELHEKENYLKEIINKKWMKKGVTIIDTHTTYIGSQVKLGRDVVLHPQTYLEGKTTIGSGTVLGVGVIVRDSQIGANVRIEAYTIIEKSRVENDAVLGPFARLRLGSCIKKRAKVGNFVEIKETTLGEASKANHLSYLGDAEIGKEVNIGCGVITCNYDGGLRYPGKAKTKIGDKSFIGSDSQLVAPLVLKKGTYVASGSTVTDNVPKDSLVIARATQITKKGYMKKLWGKKRKK